MLGSALAVSGCGSTHRSLAGPVAAVAVEPRPTLDAKHVIEDAYDGHLDRLWACDSLNAARKRLPNDSIQSTARRVIDDARDASHCVAQGTVSPTSRAQAVVREWRANLRTAAAADPKLHFPNPLRATLDARLRIASSRYRFTVVNVTILHPRQAAPFVVVEAEDKHALAASAPAILRLIDPKAKTGDDHTGWAYEGFLFEARDSHGVPFLATFNWWRGPHAGGGQWAADATLDPFPHG
jgi:hypothetical protein